MSFYQIIYSWAFKYYSSLLYSYKSGFTDMSSIALLIFQPLNFSHDFTSFHENVQIQILFSKNNLT